MRRAVLERDYQGASWVTAGDAAAAAAAANAAEVEAEA